MQQQRQQALSSPKKCQDPSVEEELIQEQERRATAENKLAELQLNFTNLEKEFQDQLACAVRSIHDLTEEITMLQNMNGDLKVIARHRR